MSILVTVASKSERDIILEKSPVLKERRTPYDKVQIKKDVHTAVRQEWKKLRDDAAAEKDRPENQGCNIRLDVKESCTWTILLMISETCTIFSRTTESLENNVLECKLCKNKT